MLYIFDARLRALTVLVQNMWMCACFLAQDMALSTGILVQGVFH